MSRLRDLSSTTAIRRGQRRTGPRSKNRSLAAILGDGLDPAQRLNIYRNHYNISLGEALKATFPVVCRVLDPRFFAYAASEFIKVSPPRQVCLFEYGEGFPDFIAAFPPCAHLSYIGDVARLEWMINGGAPFAGACRRSTARIWPSSTCQISTARLCAAALAPPDRIPLAHRSHLAPEQAGREGEGAVDLDAGGCRLEIRQLGEDVVFRPLEPGEFALRAKLAKGGNSGGGCRGCSCRRPLFDTADGLRRLFAEGLVTGFTLAPGPGTDAPKPTEPQQPSR